MSAKMQMVKMTFKSKVMRAVLGIPGLCTAASPKPSKASQSILLCFVHRLDATTFSFVFADPVTNPK